MNFLQHPALDLLRRSFQTLTSMMLALIAIALVALALTSAFGVTPWLVMPLQFGDVLYLNAGMYIQLAFTALVAGLCVYLPTNTRIMALENSHRSFHMGMRDVATAYSVAHRADREGVFQLKGEFDSIRERITFLRDHPDLAELEPSVLEVAAQMSHVSNELATTYSDRNVARARDFLIARQQEIESFNERLDAAKTMAVEVRHWAEKVELEEAVAQAQLRRLRDELADLIPEVVTGDLPPSAPLVMDGTTDEDAAYNIHQLPRAAE